MIRFMTHKEKMCKQTNDKVHNLRRETSQLDFHGGPQDVVDARLQTLELSHRCVREVMCNGCIRFRVCIVMDSDRALHKEIRCK